MALHAFSIVPSKGWEATANEVRLQLENETVTAANLIITAGAWAGQLLRDLWLPLTVKRKVLAWFDPLSPELFAADRIPVFTFPEGWTYGFPDVPGLGVKMAEHNGGSYFAPCRWFDRSARACRPGPARRNLLRNTCPGSRGTMHRLVLACTVRSPASIP